ncbi:EutP/PduV family microcompartment system protein [Vibrio hannami]|uniref:EutP/PduV family microcompartment system protein n=1 Tax=Vibrio hannami TaxID=2717094 RepID=UPI00240EAC37|nr:EutP/PduV family microcompartment system protein [Vibrio hannami]MDG3085130.1 EutP/PduV family microcompartment system protein [Vibrio hannami]
MSSKRVMLVGQSECGKTTLIQSLTHQPIQYQKTQSLEFCFSAIDTPGEYLENPRLYSALINTSYDSDIVALVQSADTDYSIFAPLFAQVFNRPVIGVVTKSDMQQTRSERACEFLHAAGVSEIFTTSAIEGIGIEPLRSYLGWE